MRQIGGLPNGVTNASAGKIKLRCGDVSSGGVKQSLLTPSSVLDARDASGRLSRLVEAYPGLRSSRPVLPHPTRRFTTCTWGAVAGRSTVERLTCRAVTRTLSFDQNGNPAQRQCCWYQATHPRNPPPRARRRHIRIGRRPWRHARQIAAGRKYH